MPTTPQSIELRTAELTRAAESGDVRGFMRVMVRVAQEIERQWPKLQADLVSLTHAKGGAVAFNDADGNTHAVTITAGAITSWTIDDGLGGGPVEKLT